MKEDQSILFYNLLKDWSSNSKALLLSLDLDKDKVDPLPFEQAIKDFKAVLLDNMQGLESIIKSSKK